MARFRWSDLDGKELRYRDHAWELTGDVDVREQGELLAVEARQTDDVAHPTATLRFVLSADGDSLNPGNLGAHFDRLERTDEGQFLLVRKERRTYRYALRGLTYD